jgi:hypothetical protein
MALVAQFAVYGAGNAKAEDVRNDLQAFFDRNDSFVTCGNGSFGDPSPGNKKHFAAVVERDGRNLFFACEEGQSIDFANGGGVGRTSTDLNVRFAVYGALPGGDPRKAQAFDVGTLLQDLLGQSDTVTCGNGAFGDPSPGNTKHFAAIVRRDGQDLTFACQENQTINFRLGGTPG